MQLLRLLRTVSYLKPVQLYGRAFRLVRWQTPDFAPAPPRRPAGGPWIEPVARPQSLFAPTHVRFLNQDGMIDATDQWNDPARDKLWLYNLHYFDDLNAQGRETRADWHRALMARWIAKNPAGTGNGWEPYPTSLRIVNWVKWVLQGASLERSWLDSLATQARWLQANLEWHLLGNHLLENAKALIFAGAFFDGAEAQRWLVRGLSVLDDQLKEQILADGGHFERSPMYHAIVLEDMLDLLNLARRYGVVGEDTTGRWRAVARAMRSWLGAMSHPDGGLSFFNDAAFGIAPTRAQLEDYASRLSLDPVSQVKGGITSLKESGYLRAASGDAVVLIDAAPIGPDYLPGHAHADTLSFEMSLGTERVIVNAGTSEYGNGPQRRFERSTAAHSTLELDGQDSSEVWSGFRVGRRARVNGVRAERQGELCRISASHDGYSRLFARRIHHREWALAPGRLLVRDRIEGPFVSAAARFHLPAGITAQVDGCMAQLALPSGRVIRLQSSQPLTLDNSQWCPEFGLRLSAPQIAINSSEPTLETVLTW